MGGMSQFPHDEFDEVQPYRQDEVGKHRAPGAAPAAAAASSGMLKWIGLLVVAVVVIVAVGWFVTRDADEDEGAPTAEEQETQDDADTGEENGEDEADGNGEDGETDENGDEGENGEDQPADGLSEEFPVRAVNAGAPDGSAGQLSSELEDLGLDVQQSIDWDFANWGTPNTPLVMYPSQDQQELAEAIAAELGIDTVSQDESWATIVVVVGPEYQ